MDDGYQDFEIKKNLNILCFNGEQQIGNGQSIPSRPLRENLKSLKDCQIVMINGKKNFEFEEKLKKYNDKIKFFYFNYVLKNPNEFKNRKLICFAGIGNPENFFELLKANHLNIIKEISFPDHYNYTQKKLDDLLNLEKKYNAKLVTTEKDYLRISSFHRRSFGMIPIKVNIDDEENFVQMIRKFI
jgi:tetraacyldisaccharide 4''-kinase